MPARQIRTGALALAVALLLLASCTPSDAHKHRRRHQDDRDDIVAQVQNLAKKLHMSVGQFLNDLAGDHQGGAHTKKCAADLQAALGAKEAVETELHDCEVKLSAQKLRELTKTETMEARFKSTEAGLRSELRGLTADVSRLTAANKALALRASTCERECSVQEEPAAAQCSCTCPAADSSASSSSSSSSAHASSQSGGEARARRSASVQTEDAQFTHMARVEEELAEARRLNGELRAAHEAQARELSAALDAQRGALRRAEEAQAALEAAQAAKGGGAVVRPEGGRGREELLSWLDARTAKHNGEGKRKIETKLEAEEAKGAGGDAEEGGARRHSIEWDKVRDDRLREFEAFRNDVVKYGEKVKSVLLGSTLNDALFGHGLRDPKPRAPSPECAALAEQLEASEARNDDLAAKLVEADSRLGGAEAKLREAERREASCPAGDGEGRGLARLVDSLAELIPRLLSIVICPVGATTLALLGLLLILGMLVVNRLVLQRLVGSVGGCSLLDLCLECWGVLRGAAGQAPGGFAGARRLLGASHRLVRVDFKLAAWQHRAAAPDAGAHARGKVESLERKREGIVAELYTLLEERRAPPPPTGAEGGRAPSVGSVSLQSASGSHRSALSEAEHVDGDGDALSCGGSAEEEAVAVPHQPSAPSEQPAPAQPRAVPAAGSRDALFPMRAESAAAAQGAGGGAGGREESDEALEAIDAMQDALRATFPTLTEATDCFSDNTSMEARSHHGDWEVVSNEEERAKEEEEELDLSVV